MKCSECNNKAVFPNYCKEHFISYFEKKVFDCILNHNLIDKKDKVMVATSGGKDSLTVLYLVKKFVGSKGRVEALVVDEGIAGYRLKTLKDLENFCDKHKIKLNKCSFLSDFGKELDVAKLKVDVKPCNICGTFRRTLLNKYSKGFDKVATGHNMDDECQAIMMNYLRSTVELSARLGPKTGVSPVKGFVQRVKPLYFCTEKEVMTYSILMGFDVSFTECPNITESYRSHVRDLLNEWEFKDPGVKLRIVENFLGNLAQFKEKFGSVSFGECNSCGQPSAKLKCNACIFKEAII